MLRAVSNGNSTIGTAGRTQHLDTWRVHRMHEHRHLPGFQFGQHRLQETDPK